MGPKKQKAVPMTLGNFLGDQKLGSWADEMEDAPMPSTSSRTGYGGERKDYGTSFGGDRQQNYTDRGFSVREQLPLPKEPPYTAHLGNLSFDVTEGDVEDFFAGCEVTSVRIVEDKLDRKPKGFGYVEFRSVEGLKQALTKNESSFQGRNIRISVADPPKDRPQGREITDWSRKGPLPDLAQPQRRVSSGPPRSFDAASDAGSDRADSRRRGGPPFEGDGRPRDFGNWERRGPLSPSVQQPPPSRDGPSRARPIERSFERKPSPAWGEGREDRERPRSNESSRPPRPMPERVPTAAEQDNQWRSGMKPDPPPAHVKSPLATPDVSVPSSPSAATHAVPAAPASRPRLNLAKRTVTESPSEAAQAAPTSSSESKANPFGAARPIDTAQRDQEVADKREQQRLQKEADDKAAAEKKAAEKAEAARLKAEQREKDKANAPPTPTTGAQESANGHGHGEARGPRDRKPSRQLTGGAAAAAGASRNDNRNSSNNNNNNETKENGHSAPSTAPRYEILQRMHNEDGTNDDASTTTGGAGEDVDTNPENDRNANGTIVDDKNVKPAAIVRDIGSGATPETTADALDDDGFEVVGKKEKGKGGKHKRGPSQGVGRALAS